MCAGGFLEVYNRPSERGTWHAIVTCFFIDTAHDIFEYVETISRCSSPAKVGLPMSSRGDTAIFFLGTYSAWRGQGGLDEVGGFGGEIGIALTGREAFRLKRRIGMLDFIRVRQRTHNFGLWCMDCSNGKVQSRPKPHQLTPSPPPCGDPVVE